MYYQEYGRKYRNIRKDYGGYLYDSKREAEYAHQLDLLKKATDPHKRVESWERQYKLDLRANGIHICNYYVDFLVRYADGRTELHEVKGMENATWRLKVKIMEATYLVEHPEIEYKVIK